MPVELKDLMDKSRRVADVLGRVVHEISKQNGHSQPASNGPTTTAHRSPFDATRNTFVMIGWVMEVCILGTLAIVISVMIVVCIRQCVISYRYKKQRNAAEVGAKRPLTIAKSAASATSNNGCCCCCGICCCCRYIARKCNCFRRSRKRRVLHTS